MPRSLARTTLVFFATTLAFLLVFTAAASAQQVKLGGKVRAGHRVVVLKGETVPGDLIVAGGTVRIEGTVNGDLVAAGGTVDVTGRVGGEALLTGGQVRVPGQVNGALRVVAGQVSVEGTVGKDLLLGAGQATVSSTGRIGGDFIFSAGSVSMEGAVAGNVLGYAGSYNKTGTVAGTQEVTIAQPRQKHVPSAGTASWGSSATTWPSWPWERCSSGCCLRCSLAPNGAPAVGAAQPGDRHTGGDRGWGASHGRPLRRDRLGHPAGAPAVRLPDRRRDHGCDCLVDVDRLPAVPHCRLRRPGVGGNGAGEPATGTEDRAGDQTTLCGVGPGSAHRRPADGDTGARRRGRGAGVRLRLGCDPSLDLAAVAVAAGERRRKCRAGQGSGTPAREPGLHPRADSPSI